ncbi:SgcJ/EcaC family oxidoreductase [Streptomyces sp. JNUCC 63]
MTTTNPGTYLKLDDGRSAVRFERVYDHPIARVWALVTEPAELAHWFPSPKITLDLTPGGIVTFAGDPHMPDSTGRVIAVDPPRRLAFTWGGDELHFDLEPLADDRTRFTLTNVLEARNAAARNAAGWDICLSALDARAESRPTEGPHGAPAIPWDRLYDEYVAAGLPAGAAIPEPVAEGAEAAEAARDLYTKLITAWNDRDAHGYAALFAADATAIGFDGSQMTGPQIEDQLTQIFEDHPTAAFVCKVQEVRTLSGGAGAVLRALVGMVPPGQTELNPARNAVQCLVVEKRSGTWRVALLQNTPAQYHGRPELSEQHTAEVAHALRQGLGRRIS